VRLTTERRETKFKNNFHLLFVSSCSRNELSKSEGQNYILIDIALMTPDWSSFHSLS